MSVKYSDIIQICIFRLANKDSSHEPSSEPSSKKRFCGVVFSIHHLITSSVCNLMKNQEGVSGVSTPNGVNKSAPGAMTRLENIAIVMGFLLFLSAAGVYYYLNFWKTVPDAPTDVQAISSDSSASVTFTIPTNGNTPLTQLTVTSNPDNTVTVVDATSDTILPVKLFGLTNGTSYTFTVTATNEVGVSQTSLPSNAVIPSTTPTEPHRFSFNSLHR
jgi:hypothetical protein